MYRVKIEREDDELNKVVMHIDAKHLIIQNLYLYVSELPLLRILKEKSNDQFKDITFTEVNNGFVIVKKECVISIVKDTEKV
ncbi:hypothetical protein BSK56_12640 [Paenibacillus borealis]|uniref:HTH LytTR-type domain-containing protein n=1 Tax=Paenibacillus borealis TaxID=160799 RepID=A0ABX3HBA4_PAEBO|nr:hypothetical protein BSK56_12640 [Paenibacillus borealis]